MLIFCKKKKKDLLTFMASDELAKNENLILDRFLIFILCVCVCGLKKSNAINYKVFMQMDF